MNLDYWTKSDVLSFLYQKFDGSLSFTEGRELSHHLNQGLEGVLEDLKPIVNETCWEVATGDLTPQEHARFLYKFYYSFYNK